MAAVDYHQHAPPTLKPHPSPTLAVPLEFERYGPSTCRASRRGRSETIGERDAYLPSMLTLPHHHSPRTTPLSHLLWSLSIHNTLADLATRVDSIALSDEPAPAPRGGGPRPPDAQGSRLQQGSARFAEILSSKFCALLAMRAIPFMLARELTLIATVGTSPPVS